MKRQGLVSPIMQISVGKTITHVARERRGDVWPQVGGVVVRIFQRLRFPPKRSAFSLT